MLNNFEKVSFPSIEKRWTKDTLKDKQNKKGKTYKKKKNTTGKSNKQKKE